MNVVQASEFFSSCPPVEQAVFLARLAHELTILGRDTYEVGQAGLSNPARLRVLNEVQHNLAGFLLALLERDVRRYPDDVLIRIVLEHPEDAGLQRQLHRAFEQAVAQSAAPVH